MATNVEFEFDTTALGRLQFALEQESEIMQVELEAAMSDSLDILKEPVTQAGSRPTLPIQWASEKQRRAFFATDGFGRGIPTQRTNGLIESWQKVMDVSKDALFGNLFTNVPAARYVLDELYQSPIFQGFWETAQPQWRERYPQVNARFGKAVINGLQKMRDLLNG